MKIVHSASDENIFGNRLIIQAESLVPNDTSILTFWFTIFFIFQEDYCEGRYLSSGQAGRGPVYSCEDCDKTFASPGKLRQHEYTHTGETPFECSIPGQKKNFKGTFILLQSFSGCDKKFTSKFKLKRHILIHSQTKTFLCDVCHRAFRRKDHLKNHEKVCMTNNFLQKCHFVLDGIL